MCSLYLKEQEAYRFYREKLFDLIAKKAIEQSEFLFKNRGNNNSNSEMGQQSRIFIENKKLKSELKALNIDLDRIKTENEQNFSVI